VVKVLKNQLTNRVLKRLKELAKKDSETYESMWAEYGTVLKEGIHSDADRKDKLVELARFRTTRGDDQWVSLAQVVEAQADTDDTIWYLTGPDLDTVKRSPHLESFQSRGIEVLLLTDVVDEWVMQSLTEYQGKSFKSVARGELDSDDVPETKLAEGLLGWVGELLADNVKEVRSSNRLTNSPSVLVDEAHGMGANMERIMAQMGQAFPTSSRILEINADHPQVKTLAKLYDAGETKRAAPLAKLLLDQALLLEGKVQDPVGIVERIQALGRLAARAMGVEVEEPAAPEPVEEPPVEEPIEDETVEDETVEDTQAASGEE
jgi:molecular chaperone HtpG